LGGHVRRRDERTKDADFPLVLPSPGRHTLRAIAGTAHMTQDGATFSQGTNERLFQPSKGPVTGNVLQVLPPASDRPPIHSDSGGKAANRAGVRASDENQKPSHKTVTQRDTFEPLSHI